MLLTSNITNSPYYLAHESFVTNPQKTYCSMLHLLLDKDKCEFVKTTEDCYQNVQFIDYFQILYCSIESGDALRIYFVLFVMVFFMAYLFILLAVTVNKFFGPALTYLVDFFRLSDSLAGATLLALGNGAPDLIGDFQDYENDTEMLYAILYGSSLFVIGFVAGLVLIIQPMSIESNGILRDLIFFSLSCAFISFSFQDERFTLWNANGLLGIYILYVCVLIWEYIEQPSESESTDGSVSNINRMQLADGSKLTTNLNSILIKIIKCLMPFDVDDWNDSNIGVKIILCITAPIVLCLCLVVPIVDDSLPLNGWKRKLNAIQIVLLPTFCIALLGWYEDLDALVCLGLHSILFLLAAIAYFTTKDNQIPKYHWFFAIIGYIGTLFAISLICNEIVAILAAFGTYFNLSAAFLGLSVMSWGNAIGDAAENFALAQNGRGQMAFRSCFSSSMIYTVLHLGLVFDLKLINSDESSVVARFGAMGPTCNLFLFTLLAFILTTLTLTRFEGRRSVGILMVFIYFVFLLFCFLSEFEIIHAFGTDHENE